MCQFQMITYAGGVGQGAPAAVSHTLFQAWETVLGVFGFRRALGLRTGPSIAVAVVINLIYILRGAVFSR